LLRLYYLLFINYKHNVTIKKLNNHLAPLLAAPFLLAAIIPIKTYSNAEADKAIILKENKNKSGIYRWTNLINDKRYVGSALDLSKRLLFYYSASKMISALQQGKSYIYSAIIKYGLKDFSLEILEYCEPDKLLIREKYYIDLGSEYNIIKDPTLPPMSGRQHSEETKTIMSDANTGENNPMFGKNHTEETKTIMSDAKKGENHPNFGKQKYEGSGTPSQAIEVTDIKNNQTTTYDSMGEAARALDIR